jgi:1,4-alpha-glucan branching enzyme
LRESDTFDYRIGFPGPGTWREIFNSDYYQALPNPRTVGNDGAVTAEPIPWDGMPCSAPITLPANGFVVFGR